MKSFEETRALVFRKRNLKYLVLALVLAVIGKLLDDVAALETLERLTHRLHDDLVAVQPFAIAKAFWRAIGDHAKQGLPGIAYGTIIAIPGLAVSIWRAGGVVPGLLYVLTLLAMTAAIVAQWQKLREGRSDVLSSVVATLWIFAAGPIVAAVGFWVLLIFLLGLVFVFGKVLAGLIWILSTFATVLKFGGEFIKLLKESDALEGKADAIAGKATAAPTVTTPHLGAGLPPPPPPNP